MKFLTIFLLFFLFTEQVHSSAKFIQKGIIKYSPILLQSSQSQPLNMIGKTYQHASVNGPLVSGSTLLAAKALLVKKFILPSKKKLIKKLIMKKPSEKVIIPSIYKKAYVDPSPTQEWPKKIAAIGKKLVAVKLPKAKISPLLIAEMKPKLVKTKPVKPKLMLSKVKPIIFKPKLVIRPQFIKPKIVKPKIVKPMIKKEIEKIPLFIASQPKMIVKIPKIITKPYVNKKIG